MVDPDDPGTEENEAILLSWLESEQHRREANRLRRQLQQMEKLQLLSAMLVLLWVAMMFVGYRYWPEWITAEVAGFVTFWVFFGGGFVIWHIIRLKREMEQRLAHELEKLEEQVES